MGSQHPPSNVKTLCNFEPQIWPEIITSRDAESTCFKGSRTSYDVIFVGFSLPNFGRKHITSRDGCFLSMRTNLILPPPSPPVNYHEEIPWHVGKDDVLEELPIKYVKFADMQFRDSSFFSNSGHLPVEKKTKFSLNFWSVKNHERPSFRYVPSTFFAEFVCCKLLFWSGADMFL